MVRELLPTLSASGDSTYSATLWQPVQPLLQDLTFIVFARSLEHFPPGLELANENIRTFPIMMIVNLNLFEPAQGDDSQSVATGSSSPAK
jgi:hypothetical protein